MASSLVVALPLTGGLTSFQQIDARAEVEYPISRELVYRVAETSGSESNGHGRAITLSSKAITFRTEKSLPVDAGITVAIPWPACHGMQMILWITGTIAQSDTDATRVKIVQSEFSVDQ